MHEETRPTWRATGRTCLNCGNVLTQHEDQRYCPMPNPPAVECRITPDGVVYPDHPSWNVDITDICAYAISNTTIADVRETLRQCWILTEDVAPTFPRKQSPPSPCCQSRRRRSDGR